MGKYGKFSVVFVLGILIGALAGAREGFWQHELADAQYKAALAAYNLTYLKAGKSKHVIESMEIDLNAELAKHGRYMESNLWWIWPELRIIADGDNEFAIRQAVSYRLANPYNGVDFSKAESWGPGTDMRSEMVQQLIEDQKENNHYMQTVLDHYGNPSNANHVTSAHEH